MTRRLTRVSAQRPASLLLLAFVVVLAAGCSEKRELVVQFSPTATPAQHRAALEHCTGVAPHTSPEPIVASHYVASRQNDVRFRIDQANDRDIAQLETCLTKQPGVIGASDTSDLTS